MHSRRLSVALVSSTALACVLLSGCGGGGGGSSGPGGSSSPATLAGQVLSRDGSTSNLGGVVLTLDTTGATCTTKPDGSFSFGAVPSGALDLTVNDPASPPTGGGGDDGGRSVEPPAVEPQTDDAADSLANGHDGCHVSDVGDGEAIEIHVRIEHGVVTSLELARSHHDDRACATRLVPTDANDDADAVGFVATHASDDGQAMRVVVEHFAPGRLLDVVVVRDSAQADLGTKAANERGGADWLVDTAHGDALPFGVGSVADLLGSTVEVRDASTGVTLLRATIEPPPAPLPPSSGGGSTGGGEGHPGSTGPGEPSGERSSGRAPLSAGMGVLGRAGVEVDHLRFDVVAHDAFAVGVDGVAAGTAIHVWIADEHGVLADVGSFTVGPEGFGHFVRVTGLLDGLPLHVDHVAALSGRAIELRTGAGAALFTGVVPALVGVS